MAKTVAMVGIEPSELDWIRMLLFLLRHPDPVVTELTRHAVLYLTEGPGSGATKKKQGDEPHF